MGSDEIAAGSVVIQNRGIFLFEAGRVVLREVWCGPHCLVPLSKIGQRRFDSAEE